MSKFVAVSLAMRALIIMQEYRTLHGLPRPSSVLVDGSDIGTDPLFYSAGTLTLVGDGLGWGFSIASYEHGSKCPCCHSHHKAK